MVSQAAPSCIIFPLSFSSNLLPYYSSLYMVDPSNRNDTWFSLHSSTPFQLVMSYLSYYNVEHSEDS